MFFPPYLLSVNFSDSITDEMSQNCGPLRSVAILGCQSSGKSTLMNMMFDTSFTTMEESLGRHQTTHGIWLEKAGSSDTLVIDCEGTDSKERGENKDVIESKFALFTVAVSEVLILNMWAMDIGRFNAGNYPLLQTVFNVNLQLFGDTHQRLTIVIVARDHDGTISTARLEEQMREDLLRLWDGFEKPEGHEETKFGDCFTIKFVALPHKKYEADKFTTEVAKLASTFHTPPAEPDAFTDATPKVRDVPLDALPMYFEGIWGLIDRNEDLNLPSAKLMLANYRTEKIKVDSYEGFRRAVVPAERALSVARDGEAGTWAEVVEICGQVKSAVIEAVARYDGIACRYNKATYREKRDELLEQLMLAAATITATAIDILGGLASRQLGEMSAVLIADFKASLRDGVAGLVKPADPDPAARLGLDVTAHRLAVSSPFDRAWVKLVRAVTPATVPCTPSRLAPGGFTVMESAASYLERVVDKLFIVVVTELKGGLLDTDEFRAKVGLPSGASGYTKTIRHMLDTVEERLQAAATESRAALHSLFIDRVGRAVGDRMATIADTEFRTFDSTIWDRIAKHRIGLLATAQELIEDTIDGLVDLEPCVAAANAGLTATSRRFIEALPTVLNTSFSDRFLNDDIDGVRRPHTWRRRDDVPARYTAAKRSTLDLLALVSEIHLEDCHGHLDVELMTDAEINAVSTTVSDTARGLYEDALLAQQQSTGGVPVWVWVLLALFARHDIIALLSHWFLLLSVIIVGVTILCVAKPALVKELLREGRARAQETVQTVGTMVTGKLGRGKRPEKKQ